MRTLKSMICITMVLCMSSSWVMAVNGKDFLTNKLYNYRNQDIEVSNGQMDYIPNELDQTVSLYKGNTILPAVFAYHCNNFEPDVQKCGHFTVPYGHNLYTDIHFTHTWFQIMNTSKHTFTAENSKLIIEVYGRNGQLIDVNGGPVWYSNGVINLLDPQLAGIDGFTPNESIFFYFDTWMYDKIDDINPPYSAQLFILTQLPDSTKDNQLTFSLHVGWEEIIQDNDGQRYAKAGTIIDKELITLKKVMPVLLPVDQNEIINE